jgi:multidrug efflux pump subunit AcrA (membrane-fusion protein)
MAAQASQRIDLHELADNQSPLDPRAFVDSAYQLLYQQLTPDEFYAAIVAGACESLGAANAAIWQLDGNGQQTLTCQGGLEHGILFRSESTQAQHSRLVGEVSTDRRPRSVELFAASADSQSRDSTHYILYLQPLLFEHQVIAVMQLVCRDISASDIKLQIPWLLTSLAAIATAFHYAVSERGQQQSTQWMTQLDEFIRSIHESLNPRDIADAIANNGPKLIDCDRLIVLLRLGSSYRVAAVTGQTTVHPRANAVRCAERLMKIVPVADGAIQYPDETAEFSPQELENFEQYVDETHAKTLTICFLRQPSFQEEHRSASKRELYGAFIAEKYDDALFPPQRAHQAQLVARHAAQALQNATMHHRVFLLPLWSALGWVTSNVKANLAKSLVLFSLPVAAILALVFVPADFDLVAKGTLQPAQQRHVFARVDGTIDELLVTEGQRVAREEVLARLSNPELDLELEKLVGELRTTSEKLTAVKSSRVGDIAVDRGGTATDRAALAAQEVELRQWIESLKKQQALLDEQRQGLLVRSPLAGEVITWNLNPTLLHRPVRRGQLLMTVADLKGAWELELHLPDRLAGDLLAARERVKEPLEVHFTLATNPDKRISGTITKVADVVHVDEEEGANLALRVGFDRSAAEFVQPGATVTARIHCGQRSLGYVWLHEIWDFLQYRVFFRFLG